ncbi:unnamed protein product [Didymodactylos carnosus]|uniref:Uncharacterized protein n=1 Tax=Didymodactylos carnosus TaxID=1234261 RepID=A0A813NQE0_9BILA|nr:unnamed protein product [Didymodactylos carnosus]CAF0744786.1 unnamed protein product [Didymodactylos carnosus]CAF3519943.1 unnamed protein product [Didymodactylos carnosus]CAF3522686.1 unnamed protein product [Didymodactylos carnosus]
MFGIALNGLWSAAAVLFNKPARHNNQVVVEPQRTKWNMFKNLVYSSFTTLMPTIGVDIIRSLTVNTVAYEYVNTALSLAGLSQSHHGRQDSLNRVSNNSKPKALKRNQSSRSMSKRYRSPVQIDLSHTINPIINVYINKKSAEDT